jgi:hypothetical protein
MAFLKTDKSKCRGNRRHINHKPGKQQRLYLIEFEDDSGYYVKCGKASGSSCEERLLSIIESYLHTSGGCSPYAKILRDVEVDDVFKRETEFHHKFVSRRHYQEYEFSGNTELFSLTKEEALIAFDEIVGSVYDRSTTKKCYTCKHTKSTIEFHTNKSKKDGLSHNCKKCTLGNQRGLTTLPYRMYKNQQLYSKYRGHPAPAYTYSKFKEWVLNDPSYESMYNTYKNSGYDKNLVPSVDRLDSSKPYTFSNIELVTFSENMSRSGIERTESMKIPVLAVDRMSGKVQAEFPSLKEACKVLGLSDKHISGAVDKVLSYGWLATHKGYQIVTKSNANKFLVNDNLKPEYRYKGEYSEE